LYVAVAFIIYQYLEGFSFFLIDYTAGAVRFWLFLFIVRQREVFLLVMQGKSNSAIAQELNISVETVKTLKKRGKQKLRDTISPQAMLLLSIICMEF
jgi:DNA-binding CsgD family transcriptional regulator